jgi:alkylhydroperoxidase/carboxymuconolactone decarboxylase family protein YurZ
MATTAATKSNHEQLFGERPSALAQTDPELIERFDNFAFEEVYAEATSPDGSLDRHRRSRLPRCRAVSSATTRWPPGSPTPRPMTCTQLAMLVSVGAADAQVREHVNGNLEVGNTRN